jgi:hypothetical protein
MNLNVPIELHNRFKSTTAGQGLDELGKRLEKASFKTPPPEAQLKKIAVVLNDALKLISAVTKAFLKPAQ